MKRGESMNRTMAEEVKEQEEEAERPGDRDTEEPGGNESDHDKKDAGGEDAERNRGGRMEHKKHKKRARGGHLDAADEHKKKMPHHQKAHHHGRRAGGHVPGKESMHRPDKRARGGATSDMSPYTAAGKVSTPDYESKSATPNGGGMGADMSPYKGGGSHRRPG